MSQVYRHTAGFLRPLGFQYTCSNFGICPLLLLSHIPVANFIASAKYTSRDSREYLWGFISCVSKSNTHKSNIFKLFNSAVSPKGNTHKGHIFYPLYISTVIHIYTIIYAPPRKYLSQTLLRPPNIHYTKLNYFLYN